MRYFRRYFAILTLAALLISALPGAAFAADAAPNLDTASTWAQELITETYALGFVPDEILDNYKEPINRAEFCRLAVRWVEYMLDKSAEDIITTRNLEKLSFTDTSDPLILAASALGITSGTGGGKFGVDVTFNRQQAAGMTLNAYEVFNPYYNDEYHTARLKEAQWSDMGAVASYAVGYVNWATQLGFFSGVGGNKFGPNDPFSREQAIALFGKMAADKLPEAKWKANTAPITKEMLEANKQGPFVGKFEQPDLSSGRYTSSKNISKVYYLDDDAIIPVLLQLLETMRFYVNDAGKLCMDVDFPELPEGFGWYFYADVLQLNTAPKTVDDLDYFTTWGNGFVPVNNGETGLLKTNITAKGAQHMEIALREPNTSFNDVPYIRVAAQIIGPDCVSTWIGVNSPNSGYLQTPNSVDFGMGLIYIFPIKNYWDWDAKKYIDLPIEKITSPYDLDRIFNYIR